MSLLLLFSSPANIINATADVTTTVVGSITQAYGKVVTTVDVDTAINGVVPVFGEVTASVDVTTVIAGVAAYYGQVAATVNVTTVIDGNAYLSTVSTLAQGEWADPVSRPLAPQPPEPTSIEVPAEPWSRRAST